MIRAATTIAMFLLAGCTSSPGPKDSSSTILELDHMESFLGITDGPNGYDFRFEGWVALWDSQDLNVRREGTFVFTTSEPYTCDSMRHTSCRYTVETSNFRTGTPQDAPARRVYVPFDHPVPLSWGPCSRAGDVPVTLHFVADDGTVSNKHTLDWQPCP